MNKLKTHFTPQLYIRKGVTDITFYTEAFGAIELRRFTNYDGSIHVAELSINEELFRVHEESSNAGRFQPGAIEGTTVSIGLAAGNVDDIVTKAYKAGATILSPAQDYDYGYRQSTIKDPFGHIWVIETKL